MIKQVTLDKDQRLNTAHQLVRALNREHTAILAGGAPRDLVLGKEIDDFDILMLIGPDPRSLAEAVLSVARVFAEHNLGPITSSSEYDFEHALAVLESKPYQVILLTGDYSGPEDLVAGFDITICQAWAEPTNTGFDMHTTELFKQHVSHQILGFYPNKCCREGHISKVAKKYPEFMRVDLVTPYPSPVPEDDDEFPF